MNAQPKQSWVLKPMRIGDIARLMPIERRAYEFPWTEGIFRDCLRAGYSAWLLCDEAGEIGGYALMSVAVGEAHLLNLCVDTPLQRLGYGRMILRNLRVLARAANATILLLEVRKSNRAAIRLYETEGFSQLGVRKGYYPAADGREDALILGLELI